MRPRGVPSGRRLAPAFLSLCALSLMLLPSPLAAQQHRLSFQLMAGVGSPKGDLAKVNVDGVLGGAGFGYQLTPRISLRVDGALDALQRNGSPVQAPTPLHLGGAYGPRTDLWHYTAGLEVELTPPERTRWNVSAFGELGGTYVNEKGSATIAPVTTNEFTLYGGAFIGYQLSRTFTAFGTAGSYVLLGNASNQKTSFEGKEIILTDAFGLRAYF